MNSRATQVGTFEVCVPRHVTLRKFIMRVLASQLHFLTNRKASLTVRPLLWPVNRMKIGVHVQQPSGPTVYSLYCDLNQHGVLQESITGYRKGHSTTTVLFRIRDNIIKAIKSHNI